MADNNNMLNEFDVTIKNVYLFVGFFPYYPLKVIRNFLKKQQIIKKRSNFLHLFFVVIKIT